MGGILAHFASRCTEYATGVGAHTAEQMRTYARLCAPNDEWVRQVGRDFELADSTALGWQWTIPLGGPIIRSTPLGEHVIGTSEFQAINDEIHEVIDDACSWIMEQADRYRQAIAFAKDPPQVCISDPVVQEPEKSFLDSLIDFVFGAGDKINEYLQKLKDGFEKARQALQREWDHFTDVVKKYTPDWVKQNIDHIIYAFDQFNGIFIGIFEGISNRQDIRFRIFTDGLKLLTGDSTTRQYYQEFIHSFLTDPLGSTGKLFSSTANEIIDDWKSGNYGQAVGRLLFEGPSGILAIIVSDRRDEFLNDARDKIKHAFDNISKAADALIGKEFNKYLPVPPEGGKESLEFTLDGDVTIPGIELYGLPASIKVLAGTKVKVTRNDDGTYDVTLTEEGGGGLRQDEIKGKMNFKIGDKDYGPDVTKGWELIASGITETEYRFDPNHPGDMLKMGLFLSSLGLRGSPQTQVLSTGIQSTLNLSQNQRTMRFKGKIEAGGEEKVPELGKGVIEVDVVGGIGWEIDDNGRKYIVTEQSASIQGEGSVSAPGGDFGLSGKLSGKIEELTGVDSEDKKLRVTIEVSGGVKGEIDVNAVSKLLPKEASDKLKIDKTGTIKIEYVLNNPDEALKRTILNKKGELTLPMITEISDRSTITVSTSDSTNVGRVGEDIGVGAETQTVEIGGEVNLTRESEKELFKWEGPKASRENNLLAL